MPWCDRFSYLDNLQKPAPAVVSKHGFDSVTATQLSHLLTLSFLGRWWSNTTCDCDAESQSSCRKIVKCVDLMFSLTVGSVGVLSKCRDCCCSV